MQSLESSDGQEPSELEREYLEPQEKREPKAYLGLWHSKELKPGGPPVDDENLRKLERDELSEDVRRDVLKLIATYRAWAFRSHEIHGEEVDRWNQGLD